MAPIIPSAEADQSVVAECLASSTKDVNSSSILVATGGKSGNTLRLDTPLPFFLQNHVFDRFGKPDYSWDSKEGMVLLVEIPQFGSAAKPAVHKKESAEIDYSIGGCPLECPFDLNEDFNEALVLDSLPTVFSALHIPSKFSAMSVNDGRWALRQVLTQQEPFVQDLNLEKDSSGWPLTGIPIFAFVDCSDQERPLTLTGFRNNGQAFNVHCMGRFKPEADVLNISTFKHYHKMNLFVFDNRPTTSVAHVLYEKLHGEYASKGKVYLEFVIKEPTSIFDIPPDDAQCKVAIKPLPGDANPSMNALWDEIKDLERWINLLPTCSMESAADVTSFLNGTVYDIGEEKITENIRQVQELLSKEPALDLHTASSIEFSDSLDMVLKRVIQQERTDCDFTDRIWSIARKCESIEELQECLLLVFQSVANKMYRPYLLLTNTTEMAKKLRAVMKGEMASLLQMRQHAIMVNVMIECGLQKLFKDYNFSLAMSHLIERGEINNFTPSISNVSTSLNNLKKLHCILEVMCLSKERLTLSVNIQEGHVKKMLKRFSESESERFSWDKIYHFDVLPHDIIRTMSGLHPIYYKIKMDSKTLLKWATTTVVVSTEQYINHKRNAGDDLHARLYYVYLMCQSGRLEK